jgi:glycosyltransferase involved in cell wall biosynthesis/ribosomal protein S18 acetylase RimI-like enzyme
MLTHQQADPVRVLHVVGDSRFGGVATIILALGRITQAEGWQVDVLTTDPFFQRAAMRQGLGVVNLDVIRREIRPMWDIGGLFRLRKFLQSERYRIVHTHTSKGGFVGRLAARLAGVPVIVHTAHGFAFHEGSRRSIRLFVSLLERIASRWCDRIVSVSEFHRDWAVQLGICSPGRIVAIPNGIAEIGWNKEISSTEVRRQLGARPGDLLVLSVARLASDKGFEYLIEAAAMLPRTGRRILIAIAGDGPARERLAQLARDRGVTDRVSFLGFRDDVGDLLAACDLVVLPSLREGLSISLLEAMAAGKPIIATGIGSQREVAAHGEMARLVPPAKASSLRDEILRLAEDQALMARLGTNARSIYQRFYTEDKMLESYRQLYFELLAKCSAETSQTSGGFNRLQPGHPKELNEGDAGLIPPLDVPNGGRRRIRRVCSTDEPASNTSEPAEIVRSATENDLSDIVTIHQKAFSNFFLTRLGGNFLREYYSLVLTYDLGIVLVTEGRNEVQGFACGFVEPAAFYRLMWHRRVSFAAPVLSALVRQPSLITKVLYGVQRIHTPASEWPARSCELSSIAVAPAAAGNGFGKALMGAFIEHAWSMDARCVYLTTDADGNDAANAFYQDAGFQQTRRFLQREGRWMNEYVIHGLEACESCKTTL